MLTKNFFFILRELLINEYLWKVNVCKFIFILYTMLHWEWAAKRATDNTSVEWGTTRSHRPDQHIGYMKYKRWIIQHYPISSGREAVRSIGFVPPNWSAAHDTLINMSSPPNPPYFPPTPTSHPLKFATYSNHPLTPENTPSFHLQLEGMREKHRH